MKKKHKFLILLILIAFFCIIDKEFYNDLKTSVKEAFLGENITSDKEPSKQVVGVNKVINEDLVVYFLDVGQADSILIKSNNEYMLIDAGNNEDGKNLVEYLKALGITKFKYVVGTHAHEDHIGGMDDVIDNFDIGTFYMPDVVTTTKTFEDVLDSLENKKMYFDTPKVDSTITIGNSKIKVLHVGDDESDLNNTSIVLKLNYNNVSFLFTGDATSEVEKLILDKDIQSTVLKVSHHGSKYSSVASFLKKVNPTYAVITCGDENEYGHPHDVVLQKLEKLNAKIYRTNELGTIIVSSDGENINFTSVKTNIDGN
ncbi:MAG: MBL fold metallo-hydrolase [Bacilli bacterium]|nr:MBL fold metallo-hydrolase [Bacilli bacterium]